MLTTLTTLPAPLNFQPMLSFRDTLSRLEGLAGVPFQDGNDELGAFKMWLFQHNGVPFIVSIYIDPPQPEFFLDLDPASTSNVSEAVQGVIAALALPEQALGWRNDRWNQRAA